MILASFNLVVCAVIMTASVAMPTSSPCPINSVCFAIDQSGSVRSFYEQEQEFVVAISNEIASRASDTRYSAFGFSTLTKDIQNTATTDLQNTFIPAVTNSAAAFQGTNMNAGLRPCFETIESDPAKKDSDKRLIVLITDGRDGARSQSEATANEIKSADISIVTVGIGSGADEPFLKDLASAPEFYISAASFMTLPTEVVNVVEASCDAVQPPVSPEPPVEEDECDKAYDACDFRFRGRDTIPTFRVTGKPDRRFTPKIVSRTTGERLGVLNSNNIVPEFLNEDGTVEKITDADASPKYRPTHFKPFRVKGKGFSGIGHQKYQGNQKKLARNRCIRVYFSMYQVLTGSKPPFVKNNINVDKSANKCVVFKSA